MINDIVETNALNQMQYLKKLELTDIVNWEGSIINEMVAELPSHLHQLAIKSEYNLDLSAITKLLQRSLELTNLGVFSPDFFINTKVYNKIWSTVRNRPYLIKLNIVVYGEQISVPSQIIRENSHWLNVVGKN